MKHLRIASLVGALGAIAVSAAFALGLRGSTLSAEQPTPALGLFFAFFGAIALALAFVWTICTLVAVACVSTLANRDEAAQAYRDAHEDPRTGLRERFRKRRQTPTNTRLTHE